jgi:hypothetical protein
MLVARNNPTRLFFKVYYNDRIYNIENKVNDLLLFDVDDDIELPELTSNIDFTKLQKAVNSGGLYKICKQSKVIFRDNNKQDTYYVIVDNDVEGDIIQFIIHFDGDDVETLCKFNVIGKKIEFQDEDRVSGLYCTVSYMYALS